MALTATLVNVTANEIVYAINNAAVLGTAMTFAFAGGATSATAPDVVTDITNAAATWGRSISPRFKAAIRAGLDGLGTVAAGAWTQAQARDLLTGNGATQAGSATMPRAEIDLQPVGGVAGGPLAEVDANQAAGVPTLVVTAAAVAGDCLLRIRYRATPGIK